MKLRLAAGLQKDSIVDGEGIRTVIWTQGCPHHCLGCHNPETWDIDEGKDFELKEIYSMIDELEGQDGITFSGGDPFIQPEACAKIAKYAKEKGLNIWAYTGYEFEHLLTLSKTKKAIMNFLKEIDTLVDGKFILDQKSYNYIFRGSSNQRIIDVKKSLKANKTVVDKRYELNKTESNRARPSGVYI